MLSLHACFVASRAAISPDFGLRRYWNDFGTLIVVRCYIIETGARYLKDIFYSIERCLVSTADECTQQHLHKQSLHYSISDLWHVCRFLQGVSGEMRTRRSSTIGELFDSSYCDGRLTCVLTHLPSASRQELITYEAVLFSSFNFSVFEMVFWSQKDDLTNSVWHFGFACSTSLASISVA